MERNTKILIVAVIVIICITVFAIVRINNNRIEEQERINRTITTSGVTEEEKDEIQQKLINGGLNVQIQESVYSEILGEEGNAYNVDGVNFEAYCVDESKVIELTQGNQGEVIIEGENRKKEEGLAFGNIIILKCIDENTKEKLIEILSPKSEENTGIIPISGTSEMSE